MEGTSGGRGCQGQCLRLFACSFLYLRRAAPSFTGAFALLLDLLCILWRKRPLLLPLLKCRRAIPPFCLQPACYLCMLCVSLLINLLPLLLLLWEWLFLNHRCRRFCDSLLLTPTFNVHRVNIAVPVLQVLNLLLPTLPSLRHVCLVVPWRGVEACCNEQLQYILILSFAVSSQHFRCPEGVRPIHCESQRVSTNLLQSKRYAESLSKFVEQLRISIVNNQLVGQCSSLTVNMI